MSGTKHLGNWSYNKKCLFYKGSLVCYKIYGIILTKKAFMENIRKYFQKLNVTSYFLYDNLSENEELLTAILSRFSDCAKSNLILDPLILNLMNSLNIQYENKYLNYCKKLSMKKFVEIASKHADRIKRKLITNTRSFNGLWYN